MAEQLYSTASYQSGDLNGVALGELDLSGWDFSNQDLTGASFHRFNSWRPQTNLTGADFSGALLVSADFDEANVAGANLTGANLKSANATFTLDDGTPIVDSTTVYNQWTRFHPEYDPAVAGITFEASPIGDFDGDNVLDSADLTLLERFIRSDLSESRWWQDEMFDLNQDNEFNDSDLNTWLFELKQVIPGDADLNGSVEFSDFLMLSENFGTRGGWSQGDFDLSGEVQFADFLILTDNFATSSQTVESVPEPSAALLVVLGVFGLALRRKRVARRRPFVESLEQRRVLTTVGFTPHEIAVSETAQLDIVAVDLDGDEDLDVVSAEDWREPNFKWIRLYENTDGAGSFGTAFTSSAELKPGWRGHIPRIELHFAHVDSDGDLDLLANVDFYDGGLRPPSSDVILWFDNADGQGIFGETQTIVHELNEIGSLNTADIDGDGDTDLVASGDTLRWFDNADGAASSRSMRYRLLPLMDCK